MKNHDIKYYHKYTIRNNLEWKPRIKLKKPKCTQNFLLGSKTMDGLFCPLSNFLSSKVL